MRWEPRPGYPAAPPAWHERAATPLLCGDAEPAVRQAVDRPAGIEEQVEALRQEVRTCGRSSPGSAGS
jgi:hypothetical protein